MLRVFIRTLSTKPNHIPHPTPLQKARIKSLLYSLTRYIKSNNLTNLPSYLCSKLASPETHNHARPLLFESLIVFLVERKLLSHANSLYERMIGEGWAPSLYLRVKMEAIAIAHSRKTREQVFTALKPIFSKSVFNDTSLRELIATLDQGVKEQYNAETIEKLVKVYIDAQGSDYKPSFDLVCSLVDLLARNSKPKLADKWIEAYKELEEKIPPLTKPKPKTKINTRSADLYSTYLSALASPTTLQKHANLSNRLFEKMNKDGIEPTTQLFNTLMQTFLLTGQLDKVFILYGILMAWKWKGWEKREGEWLVYPDGTTFVLMFRAIKLATAPRGVRSRKHRMHSSDVKIPTARELFSDMLLTHDTLTATAPSTLTTTTPFKRSTIQIALRTFLLDHDYPAAFVALRSPFYLPHAGGGTVPDKQSRRYDGKGADLDTWRIVCKGILRRAYFELGLKKMKNKEMGSEEGKRWIDHLLGQETELPLDRGLTGDIVVQIVRFGLDPRITLRPSPDPEELVGYENIPDIGLLLNKDPEFEDVGEKVSLPIPSVF